MYYGSGNYEAFVRPLKPEGVDNKSAYLIGSGLAALAAACYLVRDGQMKGENVHILEKEQLAGGACDGYDIPRPRLCNARRPRDGQPLRVHVGSVPLHTLDRDRGRKRTGRVLLAEQATTPTTPSCRATQNRGEDAHTDGKFGLSDKGCMEIMKLFFTPDEELYDKTHRPRYSTTRC